HAEWKARVARCLCALKIVAERQAVIEVDNLAARSHYLAHETPAYLEGIGGNLPADRRDPGGFGTLIENQPQFFLAVGQLAFRDRVEVEQAFEQTISEPIEQPDGRLEDEIEKPQRRADPQGRRQGFANSDRFWREFTQDDMKRRDGAKG